MTGANQPTAQLWWLVSRASGIVALALISVSVLMGLSMATRVVRRPPLKRVIAGLHEHIALAAIAAVLVHAATLLGDHWLKPGLRGIALPFAMSYRPQFTGLGVLAAYLALLVGPSFYLRRRLGARRWRKLHRVSSAIWVLAAVHTLGAGSDASQLWLRGLVLLPAIPIVYLITRRVLERNRLRPLRGVSAGRVAPEPDRSTSSVSGRAA